MSLYEILRFKTIVFYAFVREKVYRYCFLTQGVPTVLFVLENAQDTAGTPNR